MHEALSNKNHTSDMQRLKLRLNLLKLFLNLDGFECLTAKKESLRILVSKIEKWRRERGYFKLSKQHGLGEFWKKGEKKTLNSVKNVSFWASECRRCASITWFNVTEDSRTEKMYTPWVRCCPSICSQNSTPWMMVTNVGAKNKLRSDLTRIWLCEK